MKHFLLALLTLTLVSCSGAAGKIRVAEGNFYASRELYPESLKSYAAAADNAAAKPYADYGQGIIYLSLGDDDAAIAAFDAAEKSVSAAADHRELLYRLNYNRGIDYFQKGNFEKAAAQFRKALSIDGGEKRVGAKRNLELALHMVQQVKARAAARQRAVISSTAAENAERDSTLFDYIRRKETQSWPQNLPDTPSDADEGLPDH